MGKRRSRWTTDFTLPFVEKTNLLLRKTIETGAELTGGIMALLVLVQKSLRCCITQVPMEASNGTLP